MALRERLATIKTEQLADLTEIMDEADRLEGDLATANSLLSEKDNRIAELQDQANRLYARLILTETGEPEEKEDETWEDMEGDEALNKFLESRKDD